MVFYSFFNNLMLDINFIRENVDRVKQAIQAKNRVLDLDLLLSLDDKRKHLQGMIDQLKFDQKKLVKNVILIWLPHLKTKSHHIRRSTMMFCQNTTFWCYKSHKWSIQK